MSDDPLTRLLAAAAGKEAGNSYRQRLLRERGLLPDEPDREAATSTMTYHDPRSTADVDNRFDFHPATTAEKRAEHGSIREACKALAHQIDRDVPPGREKALALTQLEQAMFWANAAIARAVGIEPL